MKAKNILLECSFTKWYPKFSKNTLEATFLPLPDEICKYLEDDDFVLPVEATNAKITCNSEWSDGSAVLDNDQDVSIFLFYI